MENKENKKNDILLEMKDITKYFPGVKALDGVSLTVRRGTVHALMGENGAGKSTLMKCLFGIYNKNSGEIILDGERVEYKNPVCECGKRMTSAGKNKGFKCKKCGRKIESDTESGTDENGKRQYLAWTLPDGRQTFSFGKEDAKGDRENF